MTVVEVELIQVVIRMLGTMFEIGVGDASMDVEIVGVGVAMVEKAELSMFPTFTKEKA